MSLGTWVCCREKAEHEKDMKGIIIQQSVYKRNNEEPQRDCKKLSCKTYPYDDADSCHAGGGHDFGAVWDEVEQDGNDTFFSVVKFIPQQC